MNLAARLASAWCFKRSAGARFLSTNPVPRLCQGGNFAPGCAPGPRRPNPCVPRKTTWWPCFKPQRQLNGTRGQALVGVHVCALCWRDRVLPGPAPAQLRHSSDGIATCCRECCRGCGGGRPDRAVTAASSPAMARRCHRCGFLTAQCVELLGLPKLH